MARTSGTAKNQKKKKRRLNAERHLHAGLRQKGAADCLCGKDTLSLDCQKAVSDKPFLLQGFLRSVVRFPDHPALDVEGCSVSYAELHARAEAIASTLLEFDPSDGPPLTAVFAYRSVVAFSGVLGALLRGHGYVPLNRTFPPERTRQMLERSGCRTVIVDTTSANQLEQLLSGINRRLVLLLPDADDVRGLADRWPDHCVLGAGDIVRKTSAILPVVSSPDSIAYLLFTSGSTGSPKGVMVSQSNVLSYVNFVVPRYGLNEHDSCSQCFDMTFDLSVHDMFATWEAGARLCCPTQKEMINPGAFVTRSNLTTWFSVPSTAIFMKRLGTLRPQAYPKLRLSLFCGEALPMSVAQAWSEAAPNSIIENIYGPTELTIACTAYRWNNESSPPECEQGTVPIGEPFDGMEALIVDRNRGEVDPGCDGELVITGPQLSLGYWQDSEKTAEAFVVIPGRNKVYYRTGDRVRRPLPGKPIVYLGRLDNQIKILGHRVELSEIEHIVRCASGVDGVVAIGWPVTPSGADGIEVFLQGDGIDTKLLHEKIKSQLPQYMLPRNIRVLSHLPVNANSKYDRKALARILEELT